MYSRPVEAVVFQNVRNATIESLHHPVGSGLPGPVQSVLYAHLLAPLVKLMVAAAFAFPAGKQPVRELLAVFDQQLVDPDRTGLVQCLRKACALAAVLLVLSPP